ncbi:MULTISPECIES: class I SAM-dependent methyltransferase [unclassified Nocardioides]|uniref:class I SAM-dependent methyltransferase n=1 Tax=unclassified Nocardioides TaxID=2615069 RepID=UPI003613AD52
MPGNPLLAYFRRNKGRLIHKWMHYFDIYHRHFQRFRGKPVVVVEFGVSHGGSLQMWRDYFGRRATIYGVDIDERCAQLGGPHTKVFIGDQEDREFLRRIVDEVGPIDVVIEDGGHTMGQQVATFEEIYPAVKPGGVFLIEDLHTSYWSEYGGDYRKPDTFIEYAKNLTDQLNAWHSRSDDLVVDEFTRTTTSMHFYDSIIVFEKGEVVEPHHEKTGRPTLDDIVLPGPEA